MKTWPLRKLPFDRNAMYLPSGDSAGARKTCPPVRFCESNGFAK